MANISISLNGIDQAINNLKYRHDSVKYKAIQAIRQHYVSDASIQSVLEVDTDRLIRLIWDIGDSSSKLKAKRRNFSSIKSSINADLKRLAKKEKNPENIIISDTNVFDMTEEAKNDLLSSFTDAVKTGDIDLDQATSLLKAVTEFLDTYETDDTDIDAKDIVSQIRKILNQISEGGLPDEDGDLEEVEVDEDAEIEEIDEDDVIEEVDDLEEIDEDLEEIEIDDDQEIEEIELDEDEELEEVEVDEDAEIEEIDGDDLIEEVDDLEEIDDDLEEIEIDDDQEIEEIELDEDEDLEEIEVDEDAEIEEIDEDDVIEEVDDLEEIDEDLEEIEIDDDTEIEEVELDEDEDLEEIDELSEEELKALEEFRAKKELAEHFDEALGEREKKYNKYTLVPDGYYTIGSKKSIKSSLELQQFHMPKVYIGIYPVTNTLFEIFVDETGYVTTAERLGFGRVYSSNFQKTANGSVWNKNAGSKDVKAACWFQPHGPESNLHGKRNHPVVQVSVEDAVAFSSWIGRRLPTESEWEAAARTDLGYKYPWGEELNPKALNIEQSGFADTCEVDRFDSFANGFNICDMLGNVMEWTSDTQVPPIDISRNTPYAIAKGAAWNAKDTVSISSRALFKPGFTSNTIGFRCTSEILL
ncbi:MAG: formylglycine-generating enzyme family protein [Desulfobacterales bacterium]|nr:formylglycine-generating enzyme family protein [Desulfobacterales bacterium]